VKPSPQSAGKQRVMGLLLAMDAPYDFSGKVALVTGSSRGIGAGIVSALGQCGARCAVNYVADAKGLNRADADRVASELAGAIVVQADVGDAAQVHAMMTDVQKQCGGLDILVNNAGILRDRTISKMTVEEWESVLRVNLTGAFNCIQQAASILRPGGRIVNIASVSGQVGIFGQANYASSKAGLMALTKVAARELARRQITVNAIAPGVVQTEIFREMLAAVTQQFLSQIPLGRLGEVEDIAGPVLFLCSPGARYITGQVLNVNGGFFM
jgi:3-oxoacyl-[acyl-carrier protein] reductase